MSVEIKTDPVAERLDEMADLSECWKKNRDKGRMPSAVRQALIYLCREVCVVEDLERELRRKLEA